MIHLDVLSSKEVVNNKGNIPIKKELLNKYNGFSEIIKYEKQIKPKIIINCELEIFNFIDISNVKIKEIKQLAINIFENNHEKRIFINDKNKIWVSNAGINESIEKIYNNYSQRELLIEHLKVFSKLGIIIENAKLVNQVLERKGRKKYNSWNYYIDGVIINNVEYMLEFEVASLDNGKNNYRVQRLQIMRDNK